MVVKKFILEAVGMIGLCGFLTMNSFAYGWVQEGERWCYTVKYSEHSINERYIKNDYLGVKSDGSYEVTNKPAISNYIDMYCIKDTYMVTDTWMPCVDENGNGAWKYFGSDGKLLTNATTPDGYTVNGEGYWAQNGAIVNDESAKAQAEQFANASDTDYGTQGGSIGSTASSSSGSTSSGTFWGSDESLTYSALKHLYSRLKDPDSFKVKSVQCITYDATKGSGAHIICRSVVITYYARNSFGGMVKNQYAYTYHSDGTLNYGEYTKVTPYPVLYGDYRDVKSIDNFQALLDQAIADYWK